MILNKKKWTDIGSLNHPGAFTSVCGFQDNFIYKFGGVDNKANNYTGKIEKYDIQLNYWVALNLSISKINVPKAELILGESMECTQINRRQILIFGGKYKGSCLNQTFLLDITNDHEEVRAINKIALPFEEFFRSPKSTLVCDGFLTTVSYYMRRILRFDGFKWNSYN